MPEIVDYMVIADKFHDKLAKKVMQAIALVLQPHFALEVASGRSMSEKVTEFRRNVKAGVAG